MDEKEKDDETERAEFSALICYIYEVKVPELTSIENRNKSCRFPVNYVHGHRFIAISNTSSIWIRCTEVEYFVPCVTSK